MTSETFYHSIINHYEDCLRKYGDTHLGVDWPKKEDVDVRYKVMLEVLLFRDKPVKDVTLLDFGCGASHLVDYIKRTDRDRIVYSGLDISQEFINLSKSKYPENTYYCIDILKERETLPSFDYVIMNGVFTEKRELTFDEMWDYFRLLITAVFEKAKIGIAFNVMSKAVDWERWDLFHLSTDLLIDYLSKNLSRNVIIRQDYGLYEYTVYLYK